eukprot:GILI01002062.1.p2 GENE.GILI01002062.1~~GILI01002062.1.p2  ORF type:complete len:110 (-),score=31.27 GILI01002062.1:805-1134(-)
MGKEDKARKQAVQEMEKRNAARQAREYEAAKAAKEKHEQEERDKKFSKSEQILNAYSVVTKTPLLPSVKRSSTCKRVMIVVCIIFLMALIAAGVLLYLYWDKVVASVRS